MQRFHRLAKLSAASIVVAAAATLCGCETDDLSQAGARALRPLPAALAAEIDKRNMPRESPILVRIFKEEAELEVWKQDAEGKFALLKTYPICRWSGELGPKVKEGDRQAPEGFYTIMPGQMNPNSNYYLAFNLGFPNAYDKANDRTGAFLMVHGDCSSAGCYAMTDEQIQEIYALGRDSFLGGQKSFQVQAYPFRMTPLNLAKHRNSPHMAFWRMIKEGSDHFEVSRAEPRVDVCEKRYVFDARAPANATFHPREKCPPYQIPEEIASGVKAKEASDERAFTEYVNRGVATVAVKTGSDGGMHPAFLAKLQSKSVIDFQTGSREVKAPPGPLPANVNPPRTPEPEMATASNKATQPTDKTTQPTESNLQMIGRWFGFGSSEPTAPPATTAAAPAAKPKPGPTQTAAAPKPAPLPASKPQPKSQAEVAQAPPQGALPQGGSPHPPPPQQAAPPPAPVATSPDLIAGASPVVPAGGFEGRWNAAR
ncbi:MAG TPA: murein L,D-transpeptidase family protein [Xanthobacteraceae bacterium]|nr:murein L,D-transpeptidase family protein [Xanthobacteraceae bacterium]